MLSPHSALVWVLSWAAGRVTPNVSTVDQHPLVPLMCPTWWLRAPWQGSSPHLSAGALPPSLRCVGGGLSLCGGLLAVLGGCSRHGAQGTRWSWEFSLCFLSASRALQPAVLSPVLDPLNHLCHLLQEGLSLYSVPPRQMCSMSGPREYLQPLTHHPLTQSLTHSLIHWLIHSLIHALIHPLFTHSLTHLLTHSSICSFKTPLTQT